MQPSSPSARPPWAVKFRSSEGFCTAVVFLSVFVDLFVYSSIIPVIPFRLESLGYEKPSVMTGWLLFAYSLGLVLATPPLAFFAEKYWSRRMPLIICLLVLIGAQVMFMEAPYYWLMCLARVLQGISSAAVWVVAFAMLCDTVAEKRLGRQLGIVLTALTIGFLIGAPLGGVLNDKLGYRAPFIVGIITCCLDMVGRLLFIEKHEASRWIATSERTPEPENLDDKCEASPKSHLSVIRVIATLVRSKRASAAFLNTFISGIIFTITEPTLPLRLQDLYGFTSFKVGIIYLSAVVPSLLSTLLSGWATDKYGIEWVAVSCLCISAPWWVIMAMRSHLALLVSAIALANFFFSACVTPFTADLAAAARELDGIGYAHVFGAFNFAYSCATAIGPLLGGQIYGHVKHGWTIIMCITAGLILFGALTAAWGSGERPLLTRLARRIIKQPVSAPKSPVVTSSALEKGLKVDAIIPHKPNQHSTPSNSSQTSLSDSESDITDKVTSSKHISLSETSIRKLSSRPPSTVKMAEEDVQSRPESISEVTVNGSKSPSMLPSSSQLTLEDLSSESGASKEAKEELPSTESESAPESNKHEDTSKKEELYQETEPADPSLSSPVTEEGTTEPSVASGVETIQSTATQNPSSDSELSTKETSKEDEDTKRT